METGETSESSHEEVVPESIVVAPPFPLKAKAHCSRNRWIPCVFYLILILLNVTILFFFSGGSLSASLGRLVGQVRVEPEAETPPPVHMRDQYPAGENWDGASETMLRKGGASHQTAPSINPSLSSEARQKRPQSTPSSR